MNDAFNSSLYLLQSVVLDQGLDADLMYEIQNQMEALFIEGLGQRIITLVKVRFDGACVLSFMFYLMSNVEHECCSNNEKANADLESSLDRCNVRA